MRYRLQLLCGILLCYGFVSGENIQKTDTIKIVQHSYVNDSDSTIHKYRIIPNQSFIDKISELDHFLEDKIYEGNIINDNCDHIAISANLKNTKINYWNIIIAICGLVIAVCAAIGTCGTLIYQYRLNKRQKKDISSERFENRLFGYIDRYNNNVNHFEILNIGKGRKAFNFIFYEYEMLFKEFSALKLKSVKTKAPLTNIEISSLAISFVINGMTANSNGSNKDIIYYHKYEDLISINDYKKLKRIVTFYEEEITPEELQKLYDKNKYTLICNYANIELKDHLRVPWFWGIRFYYMPYVKIIGCILDYIHQYGSAKELDMNYKIVEASFSDNELGLLYAFSHSRENNSINPEYAEKLIEIARLPDLYNFKKW